MFVPTKVHPEDTQPERGAFFVTEGNIFPAGTIARGGTPEAPGPFNPNGEGALGRWYCRGTHLVLGRRVREHGARGAHGPALHAPR